MPEFDLRQCSEGRAETSMSAQAEVQHICAALENAEIDRANFLERCTRLVAAVVGCSRAGVWTFRDTAHGRKMQCLALYDGVKNCMTAAPDVAGDHVWAYIQALEQVGYVTAMDARVHFATAGFFIDHLKPNGVQSLMAASFSVNGNLYGAFTCSQVGSQIEWGRAQLNVLRQIGSRASLALAAHAARTALDTRPFELPM